MPCYPDENRTMPPRLRYFVYFLDFETESDWGVLGAVTSAAV